MDSRISEDLCPVAGPPSLQQARMKLALEARQPQNAVAELSPKRPRGMLLTEFFFSELFSSRTLSKETQGYATGTSGAGKTTLVAELSPKRPRGMLLMGIISKEKSR
ncbi:MAG: hypothetical protein A3B16_03025 [Candidatus Zambryskibacteria bacterium RIFCSPLOWO2_01_FULL_45_43]|uniref:Uncharacterized protein n=1 Tax=Candidatus Zambryskibacteria bacterium RIFCSPLOWO2_01_FULL_45_43 TaxID=1802762 RepID=A0A1G2U4U3_9BACT|nr:MAG: hypothetical protein A3B16_03025 [Candidatus Zambryskibacteria bacterium RIFCSPLOWO2_01_FULL_45_43]